MPHNEPKADLTIWLEKVDGVLVQTKTVVVNEIIVAIIFQENYFEEQVISEVLDFVSLSILKKVAT